MRQRRQRTGGCAENSREDPPRPLRRIDVDDERLVLLLPSFLGGHGVAREIREALSVGRPLEQRDALRRVGQRAGCAAAHGDRKHLRLVIGETQHAERASVGRPPQPRRRQGSVENSNRLAQPHGPAAVRRDDVQRRLVLVLRERRSRDDVRDPLAIGRDLHVHDRAEFHLVIDREGPELRRRRRSEDGGEKDGNGRRIALQDETRVATRDPPRSSWLADFFGSPGIDRAFLDSIL